MGDKVALGMAAVKSGTVLVVKPKSTEDRIDALENMIATLIDLNSRLVAVKPETKPMNAYDNISRNKDGIPIGISLIGQSSFGTRILTVRKDGYFVGAIQYPSLSAAAEAVSGVVRKSGWVFWKLPNGKSLKEVYRS